MVRTWAVVALGLLAGCELVLGLGDKERIEASTASTTSSVSTGGGGAGAGAGGNTTSSSASTGGGSSGPTHDWSEKYCMNGDCAIWALTTDGNKNIYFTGQVGGDVNYGAGVVPGGLDDLAVVMLDAGGTHVWNQRFGSAGAQEPRAIALTQGGVLIGGHYQGASFSIGSDTLPAANGWDVFVAKLDASGVPLWARAFTGPGDDKLHAMTVDGNGDILITGEMGDTLTIHSAMNNQGFGPSIYVARLDSMGLPIGDWVYAVAGEQAAHGIAVAGSDIILAGHFVGQLSFGGSTTTLTSGIARDIFVARVDGTGAGVWAEKADNDGIDNVWTMALDPQGDVLIGGDFEGSVNFGGHQLAGTAGETNAFVAKLAAATGQFSWAIGDDGAGDASVLALDTGSSGEVLATGAFAETLDFGDGAFSATEPHNVFLVKADASGNLLWSHAWSGSADAFGEALAVDDAGDVVFGGRFSHGSINFSAQRLTIIEVQAMFVAKFAP